MDMNMVFSILPELLVLCKDEEEAITCSAMSMLLLSFLGRSEEEEAITTNSLSC